MADPAFADVLIGAHRLQQRRVAAGQRDAQIRAEKLTQRQHVQAAIAVERQMQRLLRQRPQKSSTIARHCGLALRKRRHCCARCAESEAPVGLWARGVRITAPAAPLSGNRHPCSSIASGSGRKRRWRSSVNSGGQQGSSTHTAAPGCIWQRSAFPSRQARRRIPQAPRANAPAAERLAPRAGQYREIAADVIAVLLRESLRRAQRQRRQQGGIQIAAGQIAHSRRHRRGV